MAMLGYMKVKIAGAEVEGGCSQKDVGAVKREKACEVYAFDHTVELPVNIDTGLPTGTRVHRPIKVTVYLDQAAPLLEDALCHGKEVEGDIWFVRNAQTPEGLEGYYHINFKTARVVYLRQVTLPVLIEENKRIPDLIEIGITYSEITWEHLVASKTGADSWNG